MSSRGGADLRRRVAALRDRAQRLAADLEPARAKTSPTIERANLRLMGVEGLTPAGEPLAEAVVERFAALGPERFGMGVGLVFAAAAARRGLGPRETALAVADGTMDLSDEVQSVRSAEEGAAASMLLGGWAADAFERIDANRTAARELTDSLGPRVRPWVGAYLRGPTLDAATEEARDLVAAGADAVVVRVPRGRELMRAVGAADEQLPRDLDPPPTGSQRGLAVLRSVLDEAAAERGAYVSLATVTEGLAAPEQAVVAAFERADIVLADPFDEIALGIEPERAFVDHAAAHRVLQRSGALLVLGPGPLIAGPEIVRGEPITAVARVGRSIAAQATAASWARASGLPDGHVLLQAPFEVPTHPERELLLLAGIIVRRLLHPGQGLVVSEPQDAVPGGWDVVMPACLLAADEAALVIPRAGRPGFRAQAAAVRSASALARLLSAALRHDELLGGPPFSASVEAAASELLDAALVALDRAALEGWAALVGSGEPRGAEIDRGGAIGLVVAHDHAGPLAAGAS